MVFHQGAVDCVEVLTCPLSQLLSQAPCWNQAAWCFSGLYFTILTQTWVLQARYLVFDGDVDAVWVENMNSVMDDNKLLTLPNSERIRVQNHCKLLFEVADLQYASPATISRCGMVYVDSRNLGYSPYVSSWLASITNQEEQDVVRGLFEKYAEPCIAWVVEGAEGDELVKRPQQSIPITNLNMMRQLTTLLDALANGQFGDAQVQLCSVLGVRFDACTSCFASNTNLPQATSLTSYSEALTYSVQTMHISACSEPELAHPAQYWYFVNIFACCKCHSSVACLLLSKVVYLSVLMD